MTTDQLDIPYKYFRLNLYHKRILIMFDLRSLSIYV